LSVSGLQVNVAVQKALLTREAQKIGIVNCIRSCLFKINAPLKVYDPRLKGPRQNVSKKELFFLTNLKSTRKIFFFFSQPKVEAISNFFSVLRERSFRSLSGVKSA
jgi:hypothetical protein